MDPASQHEVTRLLLQWKQGDQAALDSLMPMVESELRNLDAKYMPNSGFSLFGKIGTAAFPANHSFKSTSSTSEIAKRPNSPAASLASPAPHVTPT